MTNKFYSVSENGLRMISGCILTFVVIINFLFSSRVDYQSERVSIGKNGMLGILAAVIIFCAFRMISSAAERINEKVLFLSLSSVFLAAGAVLIACTDGMLRADPLYVYETALEFAGGNYASLAKDGYLFYFPHQLGMVAYERILFFISSETKFLFFCNLLEAVGVNFFLWRLTDLLFEGCHAANVNVITASFLFLPQLFFILFAYGLLPGFFCLAGALWGAAAYVDSGKKRHFMMMTAFMCLAVFLKENNWIGVIALVIWLFLEAAGKRRIKLAMAALLLAGCCLLFASAMKGVYEWKSGRKMGDGVPMLLYICMGVDPNNEMLGPGWFNGANWSYFTQCDQNSEEAAKLAKQMLRICGQQMREKPLQAVKFFIKKNVSIWCEPMFQSVWSGPLKWCGQSMRTGFFQSLYRGGKVEHAVYQYMKGNVLVTLLMSLFFLVREWKGNERTALLLLYNTGGFLFHLFWEGKSQYIYPYMFILLPLSAYMLAKIPASLITRRKKDVLAILHGMVVLLMCTVKKDKDAERYEEAVG